MTSRKKAPAPIKAGAQIRVKRSWREGVATLEVLRIDGPLGVAWVRNVRREDSQASPTYSLNLKHLRRVMV